MVVDPVLLALDAEDWQLVLRLHRATAVVAGRPEPTVAELAHG
jgi:hypothetical protein